MIGTSVDWSGMSFEGQAMIYCDIAATALRHGREVRELPFSVRVLLENLERQRLSDPDGVVSVQDVNRCVWFELHRDAGLSLDVARIILPDSSGVPVLQDLAALRDAAVAAGRDAASVSPSIPFDLVVDHSLQVDHAGVADAQRLNLQIELDRNAERYRFLKWAQQAFPSLRLHPPGSGIIHQLNLESIAPVVMQRPVAAGTLVYPDFVLGGDSHTPMVNGIGVLGWGVGGIDAMAALLGIAYDFPLPEVVGVRLVGTLPSGVMSTDLVLHITQRLRQEGVIAAMVEYFGPGAAALSVPERCTIANMAPEYGATVGYFPIDERTLDYVETTRGAGHRALVETYVRANALYRQPDAPEPQFSRVIELDLSTVELSVAGPRRPQDRLALADVAEDFRNRLGSPATEGSFTRRPVENDRPAPVAGELVDGAVVIAAITSCTNTSNPGVMLAAGLVARKALSLGLKPPAHVKTSLAPGSRVVTRYLHDTGLLEPLEALGFYVVGYGCTTCAGKSGPLDLDIAKSIVDDDLVVASVLSGNRNFEGRIHKLVRANYIMSPPLVVAFALAGRIDIDLRSEPIGTSNMGVPVYLADLWPSAQDIASLMGAASNPELVGEVYGAPRDQPEWAAIQSPTGACYPWDSASHYLLPPPFFGTDHTRDLPDQLTNVRALGVYGDSLTTDHISPGGEIPLDSAAGCYLTEAGVTQKNFNTYVGRRGNHEVMARATFANLRIKNQLANGREGGWSRHVPSDEILSVYDTAQLYRAEGTPLLVLAGTEYGTGSSRDWAAKGTSLLGVRVVVAKSYERIHRANLIALGVAPLLFSPGEDAQALALDGTENFDFSGLRRGVLESTAIRVHAGGPNGVTTFLVTADIRTENERRVLTTGGIAEVVRRYMGS